MYKVLPRRWKTKLKYDKYIKQKSIVPKKMVKNVFQ